MIRSGNISPARAAPIDPRPIASATRARRIWLLTVLGCIAAVLIGARYAGDALIVTVPVESPDAILSLASHEWERLPAVAELAAQHPSSLVLLTVPVRVTEVTCHGCGHRAEWLIRAGVASGRIRMVNTTRQGTYGEALAVLNYARQLDLRPLAVVTSPYHTRRTLAVFQGVMASARIQIGVVPASRHSPARPSRWWTAPYDRWYVVYEWAANVYYAGKYRVW